MYSLSGCAEARSSSRSRKPSFRLGLHGTREMGETREVRLSRRTQAFLVWARTTAGERALHKTNAGP